MRRIYLSPAFVRLFVMNLAFFTGLNVLSVLPDHLAGLGASKTLIGLFMNLNSLAMVLLIIPFSRLADRIGRQRLTMAGFGLGALCHLAAFVFPQDLGLIFLARLGGSLAFICGFTVTFVEALELIPAANRAAGVAIFGISGLLSNPLGAMIGEAWLGAGQPGALFLMTSLLWVLVVVLAWWHRWHPGHGDKGPVSLPALARLPGVARLMVLSLWAGGAFAVCASFIANLSRERLGEVRISLFFGASALVGLAFRLFFARLLDRLDRRLLLTVCFGLFAVSYGLAMFLHDSWFLGLMGLVFGLATGMIYPLLTALFVAAGAEHQKLGLNSLATSTNTLGNLVFALLLGGVGDLGGTTVLFLAMAGLCAGIIPLVWWPAIGSAGGRDGAPA